MYEGVFNDATVLALAFIDESNMETGRQKAREAGTSEDAGASKAKLAGRKELKRRYGVYVVFSSAVRVPHRVSVNVLLLVCHIG
jgi:hypothetical protein